MGSSQWEKMSAGKSSIHTYVSWFQICTALVELIKRRRHSEFKKAEEGAFQEHMETLLGLIRLSHGIHYFPGA